MLSFFVLMAFILGAGIRRFGFDGSAAEAGITVGAGLVLALLLNGH